MKNLTNDVIPGLIQEIFSNVLDHHEDMRAIASDVEDLAVWENSGTLATIQRHLASNDSSPIDNVIESIIEDMGYSTDKDSDVFRRFTREFLKAMSALSSVEKERSKGNYLNPYDLQKSFIGVNQTGNVPAVKEKKSSGRLSKLVDEYCKEQMDGQRWDLKTHMDCKACLDTLIFVAGNIDISSVSHQTFVNFREKLKFLPPNRNKIPALMKLSVDEITSMKHLRTLSEASINKHLSRVNAFMEWAVRRDYAKKNYVKGLQLKKTRKDSEERSSYSKEDILKLLSELKKIDKETRPERYWIPLIALLSGMRQNEICQLYKADVHKVNDIWCFKIDTDKPDKKLKTLSSKRIIPIHPALISVGFIDFVNSLPSERLWINLNFYKINGFAHLFEKWFNRFNRQRITADKKKSFHSMRHNFETELKHKKVDLRIIEGIAGHSHGSIDLDRYGDDYPVQMMLEAMQSVDYGIDILKELS